jgi:hypothetical protein
MLRKKTFNERTGATMSVGVIIGKDLYKKKTYNETRIQGIEKLIRN